MGFFFYALVFLLPVLIFRFSRKLRTPDFTDKTVWITGASSGIGAALVPEFVQRGAHVIMSSRNVEALEKVRDALGTLKSRAEVVAIDLSNSQQAFDRAKEILRTHKVDILINNAGVSQRTGFCKILDSLDIEKQLMEVNYFSPIALTKAFVAQAQGGQIVLISSVAGLIGAPLRCAYSGTKFAATGYFESLRSELPAKDFDVTIVYPGFIQTNISKNALVQGGKNFGITDLNIANGMRVEDCAVQIVKGVFHKEKNVLITSALHRVGLCLKYFWPDLLYKLVAKQAKKELNDEAYSG